MDKSFKDKLLDLHFNLLSNIDSDKISDNETAILISIDQSVLEHIQEADRKNGVEC